MFQYLVVSSHSNVLNLHSEAWTDGKGTSKTHLFGERKTSIAYTFTRLWTLQLEKMLFWVNCLTLIMVFLNAKRHLSYVEQRQFCMKCCWYQSWNNDYLSLFLRNFWTLHCSNTGDVFLMMSWIWRYYSVPHRCHYRYLFTNLITAFIPNFTPPKIFVTFQETSVQHMQTLNHSFIWKWSS